MTAKTTSRRMIMVEQKHIDGAVPENSSKCMVAQAIQETITGSKKLHVDMQTMRYTDDKGVRRTFLTPAAVQAALVRFDAGDPVEPFVFRLPEVMHFSKPTKQTKGGASKAKTEVTGRPRARARVGGRAVPMMGNATRRRFGIRNLRINQEGQVVQIGTDFEKVWEEGERKV